MNDDELKALVDEVAADSGYGGLDMGTMYGEFAFEVAKRARLAEREACAALAEACDDADSAARFIRARSNAESNSALAHPTRTPC